jgi:hypothetical protein
MSLLLSTKLTGSLKGTETKKRTNRIHKQFILLERPWCQRIWVSSIN